MFSRINNKWRLLGVVAVLMTIGGLVTACSGGSAAPKAQAQAAASSSTPEITSYVFSDDDNVIQGPDGQGHDVFVPANFVVTAGTTVELKVINYDDMQHTITAPDLNLNLIVKPGEDNGSDVTPVTSEFSLTLTKPGTYRWYCDAKCDPWSMSDGYSGKGQEGFMAGFIVVQ